jgi:DNA-binding transcriptional ArsR family regulator
MGPDALPSDLAKLADHIPPSWFEEFDSFSSAAPSDRGLQSIVEIIARWAGVVNVEDYDTASAAMREITPADAIAQVASSSGLKPNTDFDGTERLIDLERRLAAELPKEFGVFGPSDTTVAEREDHARIVAVSALRGEPLHGRFWHWMDRFYYEVYGPWRATRSTMMDSARRSAIDALGGDQGPGPPSLDWLPSSNPLVAIPTLRAAVVTGGLDVIFWNEPFDLSDTFALLPAAVLSSFSEGGPLYQHFKDVRNDLVAKLSALANPTRISILRMIRMHDLDNTQLAGHLNISRPTASVHAKVLAEAGFIATYRDGRQAGHSFQPDSIVRLCDDLLRFQDVPEDDDGD